MRLARPAPLLGAVLVVAAGPASGAAPSTAESSGSQAAPAAVRYVALGDSYSAGLGDGDERGSCARSAHAYPALWTAAQHQLPVPRPVTFTSVACSGASTGDVTSSQLGALDFGTTLVSITIGGNDENFSGIMIDCNLRGTGACVREVHRAVADASARLGAKLVALFGQIAARAPRARVVVLGYPHLYALGRQHCFGLGARSRAAVDGGIDVLDRLLAGAAATAGFRFADVRAAFAGHEICDGAPWLHSVDLFHLSESYHPTAAGQFHGYLPVLTAAAGR